MAFQLTVHYRNTPLTYDVSIQEESVFLLKLTTERPAVKAGLPLPAK